MLLKDQRSLSDAPTQASCIPYRWATGEGVTTAGALRESEWAAVRRLLAQIVLAFRSTVPGAVDAVLQLQDAHEHISRSATCTSRHRHASITMETLFTMPPCLQCLLVYTMPLYCAADRARSIMSFESANDQAMLPLACRQAVVIAAANNLLELLRGTRHPLLAAHMDGLLAPCLEAVHCTLASEQVRTGTTWAGQKSRGTTFDRCNCCCWPEALAWLRR